MTTARSTSLASPAAPRSPISRPPSRPSPSPRRWREVSPPDAERGPRHRGPASSTHSLFTEDTTDQPNPPSIPLCWVCSKPTLNVGDDGRPVNRPCEPLDAGLKHSATSQQAAKRTPTGTSSPLARLILAMISEADNGRPAEHVQTTQSIH